MGIVYECIVLFGVLWFFDYAFSALTRFQGEPGLLRSAFQLFQVLVLGAYFAGFWASGRRSLPMKTMSLQVVTLNGGPLDLGRAVLRYLAALALLFIPLALAHYVHWSAICLITVPFLWPLIEADRQTLYDKLSGTRLVKTDD